MEKFSMSRAFTSKVFLVGASIIFFIVVFKSTQIQSSRQFEATSTSVEASVSTGSRKSWTSQVLEVQKLAGQERCVYVDKASVLVATRINRCKYHELFTPKLGIYPNKAADQYTGAMSEDHLYLARLFIQLVKHSVVNLFNVNFNGIVDGHAWPPEYTPPATIDPLAKCQAITMVGMRRLDNVQMVLEDVIQRGISGDFIETGVWKGGVGVMARAVLTAYRQYSRRVLLADSFEGIPASNVALFPVDQAHVGGNTLKILSADYTGGQKAVHDRLTTYFQLVTDGSDYGISPDGKVKFAQKGEKDKIETVLIKGYFKDSLPAAVKNGVIKCIAVLRLDGDLYESTWQAFENLYPYLNQGGVVIIDDFTDWIGSFQAVHDFRANKSIDTPIMQAYHGPGEQVRGAYFINPHKSKYC